jgi:DUF1680 family protein
MNHPNPTQTAEQAPRQILRLAALGLALAAAPFLSASAAPSPEYGLEPQFQLLRFGDVMPTGWIREQMIRDLRSGFAGHLPEIAPFTAHSEIFGANRNTPERYQNAGGGSWGGAEGMWWKGETEGNWRSGNTMMSLLVGEPDLRALADARVKELLATQDPDGYMGIYGPTLRWPAGNVDNGELWTQTTILRGLIAYYEATGRADVLSAVERSVRLTMSHYKPGATDPYGPDTMGHNLMYVDVVERLYDLTGDRTYRDFGVYLYRDYSAEVKADISLPTLLAQDHPFMGHGATTYEALRVPIWAGYVTGDPVLLAAGEQALLKTWPHVSPTGGPVSNEMIANKPTDPDLGGYEGCAEKEWMTSVLSAAQKTGRAALAEAAETTYYNSVQGSRLSDGTAMDYVSTDNLFKVDGAIMNRVMFSPAHEDVADCCPPNLTQIGPLFVRSMWMRAPDGLAMVLFGPSTVHTTVGGTDVRLAEETTYPFSESIRVRVEPEAPVEFCLHVRVPSWARNASASSQGADVRRAGDWLLVTRRWQAGDRVDITFDATATPVPANNGEYYLRRGPLFYAVGIPGIKNAVKDFPVPGFHDYTVSPVTWGQARFGIGHLSEGSSGLAFRLVANKDASEKYPWDAPPSFLEGTLISLDTMKPQTVSLVPMGSAAATLRRMTFTSSQ